jgi:CRP/FNR family transcriptional regulator
MKNELKKQSLLNGLGENEIEKLVPFISREKFHKDNYIFKEGEPCKGIYMIKSGKVEISKTTTDGWKQPLAILSPVNFIGEIALLENRNHASDAMILEPSELFFITKESFHDLEKTEPFIMLKIIKNIAIIAGLNVRRMNEKFLRALVNY